MVKSLYERAQDAHKERRARQTAAGHEAARVLSERGDRHTAANETTRASARLANALNTSGFPIDRTRKLISHEVSVGPVIPTDTFRSHVGRSSNYTEVTEGWILTERNHSSGTTTPATVETFAEPAEHAQGLLLLRDGRVVTYSGYLMDEFPDPINKGKMKKVIHTPYIVTEHERFEHNAISGISNDGALAIGDKDPRIRLDVERTVAAHTSDPLRAELDELILNLAARAGINPAVFL